MLTAPEAQTVGNVNMPGKCKRHSNLKRNWNLVTTTAHHLEIMKIFCTFLLAGNFTQNIGQNTKQTRHIPLSTSQTFHGT